MQQPTDPHSISAAAETALAYRRKIYHAMTPHQRLELSERLTQEAFATMRSNPAAWQAFLKRNHHQRRAANVAHLETEMKKVRSDAYGN